MGDYSKRRIKPVSRRIVNLSRPLLLPRPVDLRCSMVYYVRSLCCVARPQAAPPVALEYKRRDVCACTSQRFQQRDSHVPSRTVSKSCVHESEQFCADIDSTNTTVFNHLFSAGLQAVNDTLARFTVNTYPFDELGDDGQRATQVRRSRGQ